MCNVTDILQSAEPRHRKCKFFFSRGRSEIVLFCWPMKAGGGEYFLAYLYKVSGNIISTICAVFPLDPRPEIRGASPIKRNFLCRESGELSWVFYCNSLHVWIKCQYILWVNYLIYFFSYCPSVLDILYIKKVFDTDGWKNDEIL